MQQLHLRGRWQIPEGIAYERGKKSEGVKTDLIDARGAYPYVEARRRIYDELPDEGVLEGMCGKLRKSMCGARGAAQYWGREYAGLVRGWDSGKEGAPRARFGNA